MPRQYLPSVFGNESVQGGGANTKAVAAAAAWLAMQGNASQITFDDRLHRAAQKHAEYLNSRTPEEIAERADVPYASHYGKDWELANKRVMDEGYVLPEGYKSDKNNVESIARSDKEPAVVPVDLAAHDTHHDHMMGLGGFATCTVFGVGCVGNDYVFVRCPTEG